MHPSSHALSALLFAAAAVPAQAALVKYEYTATVTNLYEIDALTGSNSAVDTSNIPGSTFAPGDSWSGTIVYDDQMPLFPHIQPPQPEGGSHRVHMGYIHSTISNAQTGFTFAGVPNQVPGANMQVYDVPAGEGADFVSLHDYHYGAPGSAVELGWFQFVDEEGSILGATTDPASISLTQFPYAFAHYAFNHGSAHMQAFARITSLTRVDIQSPVPEPATYGMLGLGLGILAFLSRKQQRS